jgi:hypothetical protein
VEVIPSKGRGHTNRYRPIIKAAAVPTEAGPEPNTTLFPADVEHQPKKDDTEQLDVAFDEWWQRHSRALEP